MEAWRTSPSVVTVQALPSSFAIASKSASAAASGMSAGSASDTVYVTGAHAAKSVAVWVSDAGCRRPLAEVPAATRLASAASSPGFRVDVDQYPAKAYPVAVQVLDPSGPAGATVAVAALALMAASISGPYPSPSSRSER